MIENLCEDNHFMLTESLQNLLNLKLLHDAGVDVKNFGSFTIHSEMEWDRCYDIFLFGVKELFDEVEQVEDEEFDYIDGIAVDVKFNILKDFYKVPNAEKEMENIIKNTGLMDLSIHPDKKGFRLVLADLMTEEISEYLKFLIQLRKWINKEIQKQEGEQWHQQSA